MELVVDGIIFDLNPYGGIGRWYREVLPRLCEAHPALHITLLTNAPQSDALPRHERITPRTVPLRLETRLRPRDKFAPLVGRIVPHLKRRATNPTPRTIWQSSYHTAAANWPGPHVESVADMIHERYPDMFTGPFQDALRQRKRDNIARADAVLCISHTTAHDVMQHYNLPAERVHVAELAVSPFFHQRDDIPPATQPFLLYVGGRALYKNFERVLTAFAAWPARQDTRLVVLGRDWSPQEAAQIAALGITEAVELVHNADDTHLRALYHQALALVYPSLYEGFGLPIVEAFACGCPVIASDIPTSREISDTLPIFFDPTDTDSLVAAFDIARDHTDRETLAAHGAELAARYTWEHTARKTLAMYAQLTETD